MRKGDAAEAAPGGRAPDAAVAAVGSRYRGSTLGGVMRKYILNGSVLSALVGGWSTMQTTRRGPRDWKLGLMWLSWAITVAIAIGTVIEDSRDGQIGN